MNNLKEILINLKKYGCTGVKISFEDEGALYSEVISMRQLTTSVDLELSLKIGGCEAKRDIIDCIDLNCDSIVGPMIESNFALEKFLKSLASYNFSKKKGFNLETIEGYKNLESMKTNLKKLDFIIFGRVDFIGSLCKDRNFVDDDDIFEMVKNVFTEAKKEDIKCYLGGAISINSKSFIEKLVKEKLLDKFETRYIIFSTENIDFDKYEEMLYYANLFEVEWMKFISNRYQMYANKDRQRISMIEDRLSKNNVFNK